MAYPKALVTAAVKRTKSTPVARIAAEFNIGVSTLGKWKRDAGTANPQPVQLARYQAKMKAKKIHNTPIPKSNGTIIYKGKTYKKA